MQMEAKRVTLTPDYLPVPAEIVRVEQMTATEKFFEFRLEGGKDLGHLPGQFAELSLYGIGEAPISVSSSPTKKGTFEMTIRKVGDVTGVLHNMKPGDKIGVRGPFGTHFPYEETKGKKLLFVCGGLGLVPARSFINYVIDNRKDYRDVTILFGCVNPQSRLYVNELEQWSKDESVNFIETVDRCKPEDNWKGNIGVITTLFSKIKVDVAHTYAIVVGPPIMYKFVLQELRRIGVPAEQTFMSLERRMKCGIGKCGHCQINGVYCCLDGPVFRWSDISHFEEAI